MSDEWRRMESAPRDGTKIDLWFPGTGRMTDWQWSTDQIWGKAGSWIGKHSCCKSISTYPNNSPSHWMPLPASPARTEEKPE